MTTARTMPWIRPSTRGQWHYRALSGFSMALNSPSLCLLHLNRRNSYLIKPIIFIWRGDNPLCLANFTALQVAPFPSPPRCQEVNCSGAYRGVDKSLCFRGNFLIHRFKAAFSRTILSVIKPFHLHKLIPNTRD